MHRQPPKPDRDSSPYAVYTSSDGSLLLPGVIDTHLHAATPCKPAGRQSPRRAPDFSPGLGLASLRVHISNASGLQQTGAPAGNPDRRTTTTEVAT